jgi:hypothetical protein
MRHIKNARVANYATRVLNLFYLISLESMQAQKVFLIAHCLSCSLLRSRRQQLAQHGLNLALSGGDMDWRFARIERFENHHVVASIRKNVKG